MATVYGGNPLKYPGQITLFDSSIQPSGSNINVMEQAQLDRTAFLRRNFASVAQEFLPQKNANQFLHGLPAAVFRDPVGKQWVALFEGGVVPDLWGTQDEGQTWYNIAGGFNNPAANGVSIPSSSPIGSILVPLTSASQLAIYFIDNGGNATPSGGVVPIGGTPPSTFAVANYNQANSTWQVLSINGAGGNLANGIICYAVSPGVAASYLQIGLPTGWTSGANNIGWIYQAQSAPNDGSSTPGMIVWAMAGVTPGVDTPRIMTQVGLTLSDLALGVFSGKIITGLARDTVNLVWGALAYDGTNTYVYSSPDMASWTLRKTFFSVKYTNLAIVGGIWTIAGVPYNVTYPSVTLSGFRCLTAADVLINGTGTQWKYGSPNMTGTGNSLPNIFGADSAVALWNTGAIMISRGLGDY